MKIVYTKLSDTYYGLVRATMDTNGIEAIPWTPRKFPVFDMLENVKPDVLFIDLCEINKTIIEACNEFASHTKVVVFGAGVPQKLKPTALIAPPNTSPVIRKNIESDEFKTLYMYDSANIVDMFGGEKKDYLECEVGYVFNNASDPELYVDQMMYLANLGNHFRLKIVGPEKIGLPHYLGTLNATGISSFYKSCQIVIDYKGGQILDIAANGGYAVSTVPNGLYPIRTKDDPLGQIADLLYKDKSRTKTAKKAQEKVLSKDTCYHRLIEILKALDLETEHVQKRLEEKLSCV